MTTALAVDSRRGRPVRSGGAPFLLTPSTSTLVAQGHFYSFLSFFLFFLPSLLLFSTQAAQAAFASGDVSASRAVHTAMAVEKHGGTGSEYVSTH